MKDKALRKYKAQKDMAKARKIKFDFTYQEWLIWWETKLGPDWINKRGCKRGQYVMARLGDKGFYTPSNVKCILAQDNCREQKENGTLKITPPVLYGEQNGNSKLTTEQVIKIFYAEGSRRSISRVFKVDRNVIKGIKEKRYWKHVTTALVR